MRYIFFFLLPVLIFSSSYRYIAKNISDVHVSFSKNSPYISQVLYGTRVEVLSEKKHFVQIKTLDECVGWINKEDLISRESAYLQENQAKVIALFAPIYKEKSLRLHPPIMIICYGTYLEINSYGRKWAEVSLVNGKKGYILLTAIEKKPHLLSIDEMLKESKRFVGFPYLWSGASAYGTDCSGFVQLMYKQMGVYLPHKSFVQAKSDLLKPVELTKLAPGDLLFFNADRKSHQKESEINHVGIYLGNNLFIHSSTLKYDKNPPGVQISELTSTWKNTLLSAKRLKKL